MFWLVNIWWFLKPVKSSSYLKLETVKNLSHPLKKLNQKMSFFVENSLFFLTDSDILNCSL